MTNQPATRRQQQQQNGYVNEDNIAATFKRVCYFSIDSSQSGPPSEQTGGNNNSGNNDTSNNNNNASTPTDPKLRAPCRLSQVDGNLCTHVILTPVHIDPQGNSILATDEQLSHLKEVEAFKRRFPRIRVMVSIRNSPLHDHQTGFQRAACSNELRQKFARQMIEFLLKFHLDGLDLDWQFPNFPTNLIGGREYERIGLTKIISALRSAIVENFYARQAVEQHQLQSRTYHHHNVCTNKQSLVEPHLLTVAIAGQESVIRASYELKQLANLCDWLNVMSYDYFLFKAYTPFTGPISPLEPIVDPYVPILGKLSLSWTANRLLEEGVEGEKIVMGIPTYARAYRLIFKSSQPVAFSLAVGTKAGQLSESSLSYAEVIEILSRDDTIVEFDERAKVPYLLTDQGYTWVTYENARSVREKVAFIRKSRLAGYMTWNLNNDDYLGRAHWGQANGSGQQEENSTNTFPLHRAMLEAATSS